MILVSLPSPYHYESYQNRGPSKETLQKMNCQRSNFPHAKSVHDMLSGNHYRPVIGTFFCVGVKMKHTFEIKLPLHNYQRSYQNQNLLFSGKKDLVPALYFALALHNLRISKQTFIKFAALPKLDYVIRQVLLSIVRVCLKGN